MNRLMHILFRRPVEHIRPDEAPRVDKAVRRAEMAMEQVQIIVDALTLEAKVAREHHK